MREQSRSNSNKEAAASFWLRRFSRLFPAAAFWCLASVGISFFTDSTLGSDPTKVALSAVAGIAGVSNLYWVQCVQNTASNCGSADFNGVTWSLSLEWQLYAVLTILTCISGARKAVATMLAISAVMSVLSAPSFSYAWALRMQAFSLGALTFLLLRDGYALPVIRLPRPWAWVALVSGVLLCIAAPMQLPQPFVLPVIALGALLCLISSLTGRAYSSTALAAPFLWLGQRSYSVYLCHLPMILVTREILSLTVGLEATSQNVVLAISLAACLICSCAELSYRLIEVPFQNMMRHRGEHQRRGFT